MSISAVQSAEVANWEPFAQKTSMPVAEPTSNQSSGAYNVNISDEGRAMAGKAEIEYGGQENEFPPPGSSVNDSDEELMYLPEAYHDLLPDTVIVVKIGALTRPDPQLTPEEAKNQNEYVALLAQFYREERNAMGIQSNEDYLSQTRSNDRLKDEIYQAVRERLAADSRAMELRQKLEMPIY